MLKTAFMKVTLDSGSGTRLEQGSLACRLLIVGRGNLKFAALGDDPCTVSTVDNPQATFSSPMFFL